MKAPSRSFDGHFHLRDLVLDDFLHQAGGDLAALRHHGFARLVVDGVRELQADQVVVDIPESLLSLMRTFADAVERAQDLFVGFEAKRAQKDRTVEFALAVDTYVQQILGVVLELDPASAVGNDFAEEVALRRDALEEDAGRTMQLADDDALGAVDDERAVVRHQRDFAEEDFLLFDVADAFLAGFGVFGVNREPDGDLERRGISHAPLFALGLIVFQLQADRIAALVAERDDVAVERAAVVAEDVARMERIGLDRGAARGFRQVDRRWCRPFQIAALAFPVADGIIDELQLADAAEIGNREDRSENRLQTDVFTLVRQKIHLQELLVRILLHFDQIRNRDRSLDFGKINSLGGQAVFRHRIQELRYNKREIRTAQNYSRYGRLRTPFTLEPKTRNTNSNGRLFSFEKQSHPPNKKLRRLWTHRGAQHGTRKLPDWYGTAEG